MKNIHPCAFPPGLAGTVARLFPATVKDRRAKRRVVLPGHVLDMVPGDGRLAVTFEGRQDGVRDAERPGFGTIKLARQGWSVLAVKANANDWFRDPALHRWFRQAQAAGLFAGFAQCLFLGSSMGSYGALAFAEVAPSPTVIAFGPRSTLAPDLAPWEEARGEEADPARWQGDFRDGAAGASAAERVWLFLDPMHRQDRRHAERIHGPVTRLHLPFAGHNPAKLLHDLGLLWPLVGRAAEDGITPAEFAQLVRRRRESAEYWRTLGRALQRRRRWPALREAARARAAALAAQ